MGYIGLSPHDPMSRPFRGIGLYFNYYNDATLNKLIGLLKTYSDMGFNSLVLYADFPLGRALEADTLFLQRMISYYNRLVPHIPQHNFKYVMLRAGRQNGSKNASLHPAQYFNSVKSSLEMLIQGINYKFDCIGIANEEPLQTTDPTYKGNWQALTSSLRTIYDGQITVSAMMSEIYNVTFLESLDVIGCNNYPIITYNPDITRPTDKELRNNFWLTGDFTNLYHLSKRYGKKILIVESGCMNIQFAHLEPSNSGLSGLKDGRSQSRFWRTALPMFDNMEFLAGYFMFDGITSNYSPIAAESDPTLQKFISDYFKGG